MDEKIKKLAELIDDICQNGIEYLFFASLISSDNILTEEDAEETLKLIDDIEKALEFTTIDDVKKDEFINYIKKGRNILKGDVERFNKK